jgi:tRNA-dihydrouridine synthase A
LSALLSRRFSVAPMMDCTDRHARYFLRLLSRRALLYTEMITTGALLHGDAKRHLRFDPAEHPVAIQLGGADPIEMARCARLAADEGYDEININVGCPSDRVQSGRFGACLMAEPQLVADCVAAMRAAVTIPVTVKTRIGIDRDESTDLLYAIVEACRQAGCATFIIHARKAWLDGLSPKENRELPPLRYGVVHQLKRDYPALEIIINGGIQTIQACQEALTHIDGVMLGREAYHSPYLLSRVDGEIYGEAVMPCSREEVVARFTEYVDRERSIGTPLSAMTRHVLGLYQGMPGARLWRRVLSEQVRRPGIGSEIFVEALRAMRNASPRIETVVS